MSPADTAVTVDEEAIILLELTALVANNGFFAQTTEEDTDTFVALTDDICNDFDEGALVVPTDDVETDVGTDNLIALVEDIDTDNDTDAFAILSGDIETKGFDEDTLVVLTGNVARVLLVPISDLDVCVDAGIKADTLVVQTVDNDSEDDEDLFESTCDADVGAKADTFARLTGDDVIDVDKKVLLVLTDDVDTAVDVSDLVNLTDDVESVAVVIASTLPTEKIVTDVFLSSAARDDLFELATETNTGVLMVDGETVE